MHSHILIGPVTQLLPQIQRYSTKSPLGVTRRKVRLLRSRELTVEQGLDYVATWNSAMLIPDDLNEAISAQFKKRLPHYAKL
ncbi:unnamed protein product [Arabis nemorensis]|uniref:Uncharacterized protein n=1 Tax=Arabis nemorensis TaxID=586526 RepID=A0A565B933_9BRAS|nr:unnamed protein product [Arabis nemorensis]